MIPQLTLATARRHIAVHERDAPSLVRQVSAVLPPRRYRAPAADAMLQALGEVSAQLDDEAPPRSRHSLRA